MRNNRAASLVCLLPLLIPTSDDEHGSSICASNASGTDSNTGRHALLSTRSSFLAAAATERIIVWRSGVSRSSIVATTVVSTSIQRRSEDNVDSAVDLLSQVPDEVILVVVQLRLGNLDVQSELLDSVGRIVHKSL